MMRRDAMVLAGPAGCGKTRRMLAEYRQTLAERPCGAALWLCPTQRAARALREQLLRGELSGCFSPNCLTFDQFAQRVLEASPLPLRPIGPLARRQILRELVDAARQRGRLGYFASIAHTAGFLDLLVQFIEELKRLEVWPGELAAASAPGAAPREEELAYLYDQYQRVLNRHDLYDAQGRFWSARALLREGQLRPFEHLERVFVDGFSNFTRTEHETLEILAGRAQSLTISLPLESKSPRGDLFFESAQTLDALRGRHPGLCVEYLSARPLATAALTHLERHLFDNPRQAVPAADTVGLEIVAAADNTGEIEEIARRIKRLLVVGAGDGRPVRPAEILVVFRSLAESGELVRDVFARFGIPCAVSARRTLEKAPLAAAVLAWLRLDQEDWPFRQVLALLTHNYFRPRWSEWREGRAAIAAERLVRHLQISSGRAKLLAGLDRLGRGAARRVAVDGANWTGLVELARPLVARMSEVLDVLPRTANWREWAVALGNLAETTGMLEGSEAQRDRAALQQLLAALEAAQESSAWLDRDPRQFSRAECLAFLSEVLASTPLEESLDETGCVNVLPAEHARNLSVPFLFLAGLSEKAFPPPGSDNCLHGEADIRRMIAAGLPLVSHAHRGRFEMLLFYEIITRATRGLVLSYPALDSAAQPLSPSPYVRDVELACGEGRIRRCEQPDLSTVPKTDEVFCGRDLRVRAVAQALAGDASLLELLPYQPSTAGVAEAVLEGLLASCARQRNEHYGAFEGMLPSTAAASLLRERFGADHCWSPSQLEQYAQCPFKFFLERVLRLEPIEEPALAVDYRGRGQMLHALLAALHRRLNSRRAAPSSPTDCGEAEVQAQVEALLAELAEHGASKLSLESGLLKIDLRRIGAWLADYYRQHQEYESGRENWTHPLRPAHFEVAFGPTRVGDVEQAEADLAGQDPLSSRAPFELVCSDETILFTGRIDRIDIGQIDAQTVYSIIDYKSGKPDRIKPMHVEELYLLQLPLYVLAAEALLAERGALPLAAVYWHVAADGAKEVFKFHGEIAGAIQPSATWQSLRARVAGRVGSLVRGIRSGQFPMQSIDEKCTSRCPYSTVCRVNQTRALGKTWQPPAETSP